MTASRSARVVAPRARPTRSENSSRVRRPATTCSRSSATVRSRSASATRTESSPPSGPGLTLRLRLGLRLGWGWLLGSSAIESSLLRSGPPLLGSSTPDAESGRPVGHPLGSSAVPGIISAAGSVPYRRLARADIASFMGSGGGKGTRAVASHDEDTTTLGVEAARLALRARAGAHPRSAVVRHDAAGVSRQDERGGRGGGPPPARRRGGLRLRGRPALGHGLPRLGAAQHRDHPGGGGRPARRAAHERRRGGRRRRRGRRPGGRRARRPGRVGGDRLGHRRVHRPLARPGRPHLQAVGGALRREPLPGPGPGGRWARHEGRRTGARRHRAAGHHRHARPRRGGPDQEAGPRRRCRGRRPDRERRPERGGPPAPGAHLGARVDGRRRGAGRDARARGPSGRRGRRRRRAHDRGAGGVAPGAAGGRPGGQRRTHLLRQVPVVAGPAPARAAPATGARPRIEHGRPPQRGLEVRLRGVEGPLVGRPSPAAVAGLDGRRRRRRHGARGHGGRHRHRRHVHHRPPGLLPQPAHRLRRGRLRRGRPLPGRADRCRRRGDTGRQPGGDDLPPALQRRRHPRLLLEGAAGADRCRRRRADADADADRGGGA